MRLKRASLRGVEISLVDEVKLRVQRKIWPDRLRISLQGPFSPPLH